jgi:hypothetical protein
MEITYLFYNADKLMIPFLDYDDALFKRLGRYPAHRQGLMGGMLNYLFA